MKLRRMKRLHIGLLASTTTVAVLLLGSAVALASAPVSGDILAGVGNGTIQEYSPSGTLVQSLHTTQSGDIGGMCFDPSHNLFSANWSAHTVSKFNPDGTLASGNWGTGMANSPESCVVDGAGNVYVGAATSGSNSSPAPLYKFSPAGGAPTTTYNVAAEGRGSDHIDLAADNCTIFYTSEGHLVKRFNVCTNTQLPDFATGVDSPASGFCYAVRIRPNHEVMVACDHDVVRLDANGAVLATYSAASLGLTPGQMFAMSLAPDNTSFWTGDISDSKVAHAQIVGGATIGSAFTVDKAGGSVMIGLIVAGEIRSATTSPSPSPSSSAKPGLPRTGTVGPLAENWIVIAALMALTWLLALGIGSYLRRRRTPPT